MTRVKSDRELCLCEKCVSYPGCATEPILLTFCLTTQAPCAIDRRGCQCVSCKVHARYGFKLDYYCADGSEESRKVG
jgi:hypothetical protein